MTDMLVDPSEPLERQNAKLRAISAALIRRIESETARGGAAYAQFERAVMLENEVRKRTEDLETAMRLLNESNARLASANAEIETARRDLTSAIEAIQEGFALFDADDRLILFNSRFCWQMPDARAALTPGMPFETFVEQVGQSRHLDLPEGASRLEWCADRLRNHRDSHVAFNVAIRGDRWQQVNEYRTANGGTAILQSDITDIIRAERTERDKLVDAQSRLLRATLDHLKQGVAIFDHGAQLVGWNTRLRSLTGIPPTALQLGSSFARLAEHISRNFRMSGLAEERRLAQWVAGRALKGRPLSFEISGNGGTVLDVFLQRLPDQGFIISLTDITREREAAEKLTRANESLERRVLERTFELQEALRAAERSNMAKSRFVAAASHDLLQPLSAAKLYLAAIDEEPNAAVAAKASEALSSVEAILGALLDISRLETEGDGLSAQPIALSDILAQLAHTFAPLAARKGLALKIVPSTECVISDPLYLRRILHNLVSNAIRYTSRGKVLVGARRSGGEVRLEVWDTGPGIAAEDRAVIFEEFRRLNRRASASEGMGLGLAIVERACARLGHGLELRSEPGKGSGFLVTLAACERGRRLSEPAGTVLHRRTPLARPAEGLIVLLVDNDTELRQALVGLLESWGVSVLDAASGEGARALLDDIAIVPDAMLIDHQLDAGECGIALACALRAEYGPCPARIISADRSNALRQRCAEASAPLMPKPLDTDALLIFLVGLSPPTAP